jgi:opacity protein-like surface antigen
MPIFSGAIRRHIESKWATMRKMTTVSIVATVLLAFGSSAKAQGVLPFAVEVRGGYGFPTGEWTEDSDAENGSGFGLNAQVRVAPLTSLYAGWERYSFDVGRGDPDIVAVEGHTTDSEVRFGAQVTLPLSAVTGLSPFAFAGLTYTRVKTGTSVILKSAGALGYEAGAGVAVPIVPTLSLTPAVRYRSHRAEFVDNLQLGFEGEETTISYWSLGIGLKLGI